MKKLHRFYVAGLVAVGVAVGLAGPADAEKVVDDNVRINFTVTGVDNLCTDGYDDITLDGSEHLILKTWIDENGDSQFVSYGQISWSGAAADGTRYVGSDKFHSSGRVDGSVVSTSGDNSTLIVSQGADPNFYLRYKVAMSWDMVTGDTTFTLIKDSTECRG